MQRLNLKHAAPRRAVSPDPRTGSDTLAKFWTNIFLDRCGLRMTSFYLRRMMAWEVSPQVQGAELEAFLFNVKLRIARGHWRACAESQTPTTSFALHIQAYRQW